VDVVFPDGTRVRASSLLERREDDPERDFGLYLDRRWDPTWPAVVVDWANFGLPADDEEAFRAIVSAWERARAGGVVEVGCYAALGRTGTVLSCMAILAGVPAGEAVTWVRMHYRPHAVETQEQEAWVDGFAERLHGASAAAWRRRPPR